MKISELVYDTVNGIGITQRIESKAIGYSVDIRKISIQDENCFGYAYPAMITSLLNNEKEGLIPNVSIGDDLISILGICGVGYNSLSFTNGKTLLISDFISLFGHKVTMMVEALNTYYNECAEDTQQLLEGGAENCPTEKVYQGGRIARMDKHIPLIESYRDEILNN